MAIPALVTITDSGTVAFSSDGTTWTTNTALNALASSGWGNASGSGKGLCYSPDLNKYCAINSGTYRKSATSSDGVTWTAGSSMISTDNGWTSVCWASALGLFVAVNSSGVTNNVAVSSDGLTWTTHSLGEANFWQAIAWSPSLGILVAMSVTGTHQLAWSNDGSTWTLVSPPMTSLQALAWDPTLALFCVSCFSSNNSATSPDGKTWTAHSSNTPLNQGNHHDMCALAGGGFAVAEQGQTIATSTDGSTWAQHAHNDGATSTAEGICYSAILSKYFACMNSGTTQGVISSSDAATWATSGTLTTAATWVAIAAQIAAPVPPFKFSQGTVIC